MPEVSSQQSAGEIAFLVMPSKSAPLKAPKLVKAVDGMFFTPEDAFEVCNAANLTFDPSGQKKAFNVVQVEVKSTHIWPTIESYEQEMES